MNIHKTTFNFFLTILTLHFTEHVLSENELQAGNFSPLLTNAYIVLPSVIRNCFLFPALTKCLQILDKSRNNNSIFICIYVRKLSQKTRILRYFQNTLQISNSSLDSMKSDYNNTTYSSHWIHSQFYEIGWMFKKQGKIFYDKLFSVITHNHKRVTG